MVPLKRSLLLCGGRVIDENLTSEEFLSLYPRGAYTNMRTIGHSNIFLLSMHIDRLMDSLTVLSDVSGSNKSANMASSIIPSTTSDSVVDLHDHSSGLMNDKLRSMIMKNIDCTVRTAQSCGTEMEGNCSTFEYRITVLCTWLKLDSRPPLDDYGSADEDEDNISPLTVYTLISPFKARDPSPVIVEVFGRPRINAGAKDSQWVKERKIITLARGHSTEDVILMEEDGKLTEGTETNFFVINSTGELCTADEHILKGTVRRLVIDVAKEAGIPVRFESPSIYGLDTWQEAFITSTSRWILPIATVRCRDPNIVYKVGGVGRSSSRDLPSNEKTTQLLSLLMARIHQFSEPILSERDSLEVSPLASFVR